MQNGIWLCATHADQIDGDEVTFTVELLRAWKVVAEHAAKSELGRPSVTGAARIRSEVATLMRYPDATRSAPEPRTTVEKLVRDKLPMQLFDLLMKFDATEVPKVPHVGADLADFADRYYAFRTDARSVEDEALGMIGGQVQVRFRGGWQIYLTYAELRFAGLSQQEVIARGDFLNFDITWQDAERVFTALSSHGTMSLAILDLFRRQVELGTAAQAIATRLRAS